MPFTCARRPSDDALLDRTLAAVVSDRFDSRIVAIERRSSEHASSYLADVVVTTLENGRTIKLFFKDLGASRRPKDGALMRREREILVYRELLAGTDLGTPEYYASVLEPVEDRFWLLLEFVEGHEVRYCQLEHWFAVVNWLGTFQVHFEARLDEVRQAPYLLHHDAEFFESRIAGAFDAVGHFSSALLERFSPITRRYDDVVEGLLGQPQTLVHGAFRPQNLLCNIRDDPGRVCPADWERAALGGRLYDLACFTDGFKPPTLYELWDTYDDVVRRGGITMPDRDETLRVVDCVRLHRVVNWLSLSRERGYSPTDVEGLVALAEQLADGLGLFRG